MSATVGVDRPDVWAALEQALDIGLLRPELAADVEVVRFATRWGGGYTMVKNPRGPSYFRFTADEGELMESLDGSRTVRELVVDRLRASDTFDVDGVVGLVELLLEGDFLVTRWADAYELVEQSVSAAPDRWLRRVRHALRAQTVQVKRIDTLVDRVYRWGGRWLFTLPSQLVLLSVLFGGAVLFYLDVHDKHFTISSKALATSFGLLFLLDLVATMIHEAGHALAIKHAGRRVLSAGFQLYLGHPAFFIDSADIMLASPRQRIRQAWYGPYSGFVIAGLAGALVWLFPSAGTAQVLFNLAVLTYVTAAMNLIPFLELDGYWMLLDALQTTDLRPRSFAFLRRELPGKVRRRESLTSFDWALLLFGVIGAVFTVLALVTSYFFWRPVFGAFVANMWHSGLLGQVLLVLITVFILGPLVHWVVEASAALARRSRFAARRLRFHTELGWRREAGELISSIPLLADIPLDALNELAGRVTLRRITAGGVVVRQGARANEFFLVRTGRVSVVDELPDGDEDVLRTMGRGEAFGELALLQSTTRSATVRAETDVELFVIDKGSFDRLLADHVRVPDLAPSVSALTDVWSLPAFRPLSAGDARAVAEAGEWRAMPSDVDVFTEGEHGDAFYVVAAGRLVVVEGDTVVRDLGPGDHFGEVALLLDVPRTATVRTRTPVRLYRLDRAAFDGVVAGAFRNGSVALSHHALPERT